MLKKLQPIILNKYLLSGAAFLIWMMFFDPKDIPSSLERRAKLKELQKSEQISVKMIAETSKDAELLKTSPATIEKFARENHLMKKDNEDLFIVNTTKNDQ